MELSGLLDDRNMDLWNSLNSVCDISVEVGKNDWYEVFSKGKSHTIYVPKNKTDISSFTHELLHIYLLNKGKTCPGTYFDYSKGLRELKSINAELYSILDGFMNRWADLDIEDIGSKSLTIQYDFIENLSNWIKKHRII